MCGYLCCRMCSHVFCAASMAFVSSDKHRQVHDEACQTMPVFGIWPTSSICVRLSWLQQGSKTDKDFMYPGFQRHQPERAAQNVKSTVSQQQKAQESAELKAARMAEELLGKTCHAQYAIAPAPFGMRCIVEHEYTSYQYSSSRSPALIAESSAATPWCSSVVCSCAALTKTLAWRTL